MDKYFIEAEKAVFRRWEEDYSFPLTASIRKKIKENAYDEYGISVRDLDGDPETQDIYLKMLDRVIPGYIMSSKYSFFFLK